MREVQLTITYRFIERAIFIVIILLLLILLITKYVGDSDCACNDVETPTTVVVEEEEETTTVVEEEEEPVVVEEEEETEEELDTSDVDIGVTPGELEVELGKIDFEVQESGAAKINNIKLSVKNGLDEDVKLFASIYLDESGNQDLDPTKAFWDRVEMPLVPAGKKLLVTIEPSLRFPPGLEGGSKVIIAGDFEDFSGKISVSDQITQTV